jgi:hypothetical protein
MAEPYDWELDLSGVQLIDNTPTEAEIARREIVDIVRRVEGELAQWHAWHRAWVFGGDAPWPGQGSTDPRDEVAELAEENEQLKAQLAKRKPKAGRVHRILSRLDPDGIDDEFREGG